MPRCLPNVVFAGYQYQAWYEPQEESPLLSIIDQSSNKTIYFCRYCFKYTGVEGEIALHESSWCRLRQEPSMLGSLRCTKGDYYIYEVDPLKSSQHKLFAQCLCLNAKLFLSSKYIFYDLSGFVLYAVYGPTPANENQTSSGYGSKQQIMGFFSKERISWDDNNLSCILVFPPFHSRRLGQLLISFSYALSQSQGLIGSPEKPLSRLGSQAYQTFWKQTVSRVLNDLYILSNKLWNDNTSHNFKVSLKDLSTLSGMRPEDVFLALAAMDAFQPLNGETSINWQTPIKFDSSHLCIDLSKLVAPSPQWSNMLVETQDLIL